MEIFILWMAMTWVNVSAIIRQDFSTVAGCDLALCPHTQVSTAAKLYMINMVALICHTRLLPILNCLLRFIFVHKIQTTYIPMDFVTMRTGGTSTSGFASHKQIISDHQKAFKRNGIYSNVLLESLRYIYKIHEVLLTKITR